MKRADAPPIGFGKIRPLPVGYKTAKKPGRRNTRMVTHGDADREREETLKAEVYEAIEDFERDFEERVPRANILARAIARRILRHTSSNTKA